MKLPVRKSNAADRDIAEAAEFISRNSLPAAIRFLDAVDQTEELLASNPHLGQRYPNPRFNEMRFWPISGFRSYTLFYQVFENYLLIVRILRGGQDYHRVLRD